MVFGRVVRAVHAGIEKDVEMGGEGKVGKSVDVVSVGRVVGRIGQEWSELGACTWQGGGVCWWNTEFFPFLMVVQFAA